MSILTQFDLTEINGINGFQINGLEGLVRSGRSLSVDGDINNDGFDDILIGAGSGGNDNGRAFVIFGRSDGFKPVVELSDLGSGPINLVI
ncbi:FG-GAP repeat protein [Parvularcula sp. IMCC14364]|uniref:integrin alpha n=1 Tax=Parvularcula sp. IMCC14364 TaxID=3067902 RepID=UPI002740BFA3|nr:FG-GAP repeat protein [Parvularcula sp. IMCC14364]